MKLAIQNSATPTEAIDKLSCMGIKGFEGYSEASKVLLDTEIDNLIQRIAYIDETPDFKLNWNF